MRISEIWTPSEVAEINANLRRAAEEQERLAAAIEPESAEDRVAFLSLMYGGGPSDYDFEAARLEKERLANRKLSAEIAQLTSATTRQENSLDAALTKAKIAQISANIASKWRENGHATT